MAEDPVLTPLHARLFEYVVIVSLQREGKKGYQKSSGDDGCFQPVVTDRWPPVDVPGCLPFPDGVAPFAFPRGARLAHGVGPLPKSHSFVTTVGDGSRVFGTALVFFESTCNDDDDDDAAEIAVPRAIILLSRWPILTAMRRVVAYLFRISLSGVARGTPPLERALVALLALPAPPAGRAIVQATIGDEVFFLRRAAPNSRISAANLHFALRLLAAALPPVVLLRAWHALLLERSIVLVSCAASALTPVALALTSLLYPFKYRHVFVPLLPRDMGARDVLAAPVPFLIGIVRGSEGTTTPTTSSSSSSSVLDDIPPGVFVIDLDAGTAGTMGGGGGDSSMNHELPPLPTRAGAKLLAALNASSSSGGAATWARSAFAHLDDAFFHAMRPTDDDNDQVTLARAATESPAGSGDEGLSSEEEEAETNRKSSRNTGSSSSSISNGGTRGNVASSLRRSFFRFFVAILKPSIMESALREGFDIRAGREKLLAAAPADSRPFLSALSDTMMWGDHICAAVGGADGMGAEAAAAARVDVAFFADECAAKSNRSAFTGRVRARLPTPFLSDTRWAPTRLIVPSPPQRFINTSTTSTTTNNPDRLFSYVPFPHRFDIAYWIDARERETNTPLDNTCGAGVDDIQPLELPQVLPFAKGIVLTIRETTTKAGIANDSLTIPTSSSSSSLTTATATATLELVTADIDADAPIESWLLALEGALPTVIRDAAKGAAHLGPLEVATARAAASTAILDAAWAARSLRHTRNLPPSLLVARVLLRLACAGGSYALGREAMGDVRAAGGTLSRTDFADLQRAFSAADQSGLGRSRALSTTVLSQTTMTTATTTADLTVPVIGNNNIASPPPRRQGSVAAKTTPNVSPVSKPAAEITTATATAPITMAPLPSRPLTAGTAPAHSLLRLARVWLNSRRMVLPPNASIPTNSNSLPRRAPPRKGSAAALAAAAKKPTPLSPIPQVFDTFCGYTQPDNPYQSCPPPPPPSTPLTPMSSSLSPIGQEDDEADNETSVPITLSSLIIDTSHVRCRHCNGPVSESQIRAGFRRGAGADYTTECPLLACAAKESTRPGAPPARKRFVARLLLSGAHAKSAEWLPPAVVLRESRGLSRGSVLINGAARVEAAMDPWGRGFAISSPSLFFSALYYWREAGFTVSLLAHCMEERTSNDDH